MNPTPASRCRGIRLAKQSPVLIESGKQVPIMTAYDSRRIPTRIVLRDLLSTYESFASCDWPNDFFAIADDLRKVSHNQSTDSTNR